jgi:deoxycytidine triphosphate deaminase
MINEAIVNPKEVLEKGIIYVESGPTIIVDEENPENQCQQVGIDLRLAKAFKIVGPVEFSVSKKTTKPNLIEIAPVNGYYYFESGEQYAIDFIEDVRVPADMAALVINRSTVNRFSGTVTSGVYDPGFQSKGGCGAIFRPTYSTKIEQGFRMAQIVFYRASSASLYSGQYQNT